MKHLKSPFTITSLASALFYGLSLPVFAGTSESDTTKTDQKYLETIFIVGESDEMRTQPGSAHYVDTKTLETFEFNDIQQVLVNVPGVYFRQEDGYGLRPNIGLRGTTTERSEKIVLMEDGVLIAPAPYAAPAAYYFPMVSRMTAVEVFKGPASIQYGPHTVGGAVNLVTRQIPGETEGMVDLSGGEAGYGKLHAYYGGSNEGFGFLVEGIKVRTDGFKELDTGDDTGFDKNNLMAKFRMTSGPTADRYQFLELKLNYADEQSDETYLGLTEEDFRNNPNHRYAASQNALMDWEHQQFLLTHLIDVTPDFQLTTKIYWHEFERAWTKLNRFVEDDLTLNAILSNPDGSTNTIFYDVLTGERDSSSSPETLLIGTNARKYESKGIQLTGQWLTEIAGQPHTLETGLRLHQDEIIRNHTEEGFDMVSGNLVSSIDAYPTTQNHHSAEALSMYIHDAIEWNNMTLTLGLRGEMIDTKVEDTGESNSTDILLPGAGIFYRLNEELGLLLGVHKGFSPVAPGQPDEIDPEESINYEAGFRYKHGNLNGEIIGFYTDYENLLALCRFSSGCTEDTGSQFNGGEVEAYGVEAQWAYLWETGFGISFPLQLTYTYTQAEFQSSFSSDFAQWGTIEKGDPVPYLPKQQAVFSLGLDTESWRNRVLIKFIDEMAEQAGTGGELDGKTTPSLAVVDLASVYYFSPKLETYFSVDNLFDRQEIVSRRPFGARPNKPRQIKVGVKYHF